MCKVIMFTDLTKYKGSNKKLVNTCQYLLSDQDDGFGYAMRSINGTIAGQRTNKIKTFLFNNGDSAESNTVSEMPKYAWSDKSSIIPISNAFGNTALKLSGPAVFHGRVSTNNKGLINVHPLTYDNQEYLIHNGVVTNKGPKHDMMTQNDTEHLLHYMTKGQGIDDISKYVSGYYAFGMIRANGSFVVARDAIAQLYSAWIPKYETYIFATTKDLIEEFCETMKVAFDVIEKMSDNTYLEFLGNTLTMQKSFSSLGFGYAESSLATKSLGYEIHDATSPTADKWRDMTELADAELDYLDFLNKNVTKNCYIEIDKTEVAHWNSLSDEDKLCADVYNVHGECLADLYMDYARNKVSA